MSDNPDAIVPIVLGEDTVIARSASVLTAAVRDETIMMRIESGRYFGLDDIGSEIWRRIETPLRFAEIVDGLAADYNADRTTIADDVRKLLSEMAAQDVVKLS